MQLLVNGLVILLRVPRPAIGHLTQYIPEMQKDSLRKGHFNLTGGSSP